MKKLLLSLSLLVPMMGYASVFPPVTVQKMIDKQTQLKDKCLNNGSDKVCEQADVMVRKIQQKGWCWGSSTTKNPSQAELDWVRCKDDLTGFRR